MQLFRQHKVASSISVVIALLAVLGGIWWYSAVATSRQYDVVVVGAGPGGIAASIQAAQMGANVALLEPTDWVGGQMTAAGVGTMDEGSLSTRNDGIYKDFVDRVTAYYRSQHKSVDTCYYGINSLCVDPQVGQRILREMLQAQSKHLQLFMHTAVTSVVKNGSTVTGVVANGKTFSAKVVIDADEYGDVLAQAGAAYRIGNGTSSAAPTASSCIQSITYTAVIKEYPKGVPVPLRFTSPPPGYSTSLVHSFSQILAQNGFDHFVQERNPMSFLSYAAYRGLPDLSNKQNYNVMQQNGHTITRTTLNLGNDFPATGTLSPNFVTDPKLRITDTCQAKLLTLQLLYYIQHDLHQTNWSVADDEGYNTAYNQQHHCPQLKGYEAFENNLPQEPYVREARRLVGSETLTGNELQYAWKDKTHPPTFSDSIAVGYYPMDVHVCRAAATLEPGLDAPGDISAVYNGGAFEVPIGVLIPQRLDGLLAAEKNISVSRMAEGAIREQPIAMAIGQAAGALAALSVQRHEQPRNVPVSEVQAILTASGAVTTVPGK